MFFSALEYETQSNFDHETSKIKLHSRYLNEKSQILDRETEIISKFSTQRIL